MLLRLIVRLVVIKKPQWDDYTILLAVVGTVAYLIEILVGGANGMGTPVNTLTLSEKVIFMKMIFSIEVTYYIIVGLVKVSILFAYLRFGMCSQSVAPCWCRGLFYFMQLMNVGSPETIISTSLLLYHSIPIGFHDRLYHCNVDTVHSSQQAMGLRRNGKGHMFQTHRGLVL